MPKSIEEEYINTIREINKVKYKTCRQIDKSQAEDVATLKTDIFEQWLLVYNEKLNTSTAAGELTNRELEIVRLILEGYDLIRIAQKLSISRWTVKTHIKNIHKKLKINTNIELLQTLKL
ncbi:hypothetical protein ES705_17228 [subsurface metagenome]